MAARIPVSVAARGTAAGAAAGATGTAAAGTETFALFFLFGAPATEGTAAGDAATAVAGMGLVFLFFPVLAGCLAASGAFLFFCFGLFFVLA